MSGFAQSLSQVTHMAQLAIYALLHCWFILLNTSGNYFFKLQKTMLECHAELLTVNKHCRAKDLTYIDSLWDDSSSELQELFNFLSNNWDTFSPFYEAQLQDFQDLISSKMELIEDYGKVFPQLGITMISLEKTNQYKGNRKKVAIEEQITDLLFRHFLEDIATSKDRNGIYYVRIEATNTRIALHDYIANCQLYCQSPQLQARWIALFSKVEANARQREGIDLRENIFVKQIQKERLPALECLGCFPFFYASHNIYDPVVNSTPLVVLGAVGRIRQLESKLKDEICWLLNEHGGVILFDCATRNREVFPVGDLMSLQLKTEIEQTITSYIQCISPPVQANNFTISFVPIVKNPFAEERRQGAKVVMEGCTYVTSYYQREFIEGVYVTRIKINPTVPERLHFWVNDQRPIFPQKVNGKIASAPGRRIAKLIRKRFNEYYVPENAKNKEELRFMRKPLSYFHAGECLAADFGVQVVPIAPRESALMSLEESFAHISLVLARKCDLGTIKQRLMRRGIACEVQSRFESYKFRYAMNSALLYHNLRFDLLLKEITYQKEFEFAGKYITILCVTPFVKLIERSAQNILPEGDFENIRNFFSKQFPQDALRLWRYNCDYQSEFYFKAGSPTKTIFLYYILNQLGQKSTLKNPKNFDKLTQLDINQRFKLFYPRNQQHLEVALKNDLRQSCQVKVQQSSIQTDLQ